jgi:hypothetical protein
VTGIRVLSALLGVAVVLCFDSGAALAAGDATSASFDVVNVASDLVYVVALPFAAIATTYLYFDLAARSAVRRARSASSA